MNDDYQSLAIDVSNIEDILLLLEHRADVHLKNSAGINAFDMILSNSMSPDSLTKILDARKDIVNYKDNNGNGLLHLGIMRKISPNHLKVIIQRSDININDGNLDKQTAAHLAIEKDYMESFVLLVKFKADLSKLNKQDVTPYDMILSNESRAEYLREILKYQDVNVKRNANGDTLLHHPKLTVAHLRIALENKADVMIKNIKGETALHKCVIRPNSGDVLKLMLTQKNVDIDAEDNESRSPLCLAVLNRSWQSAQILVESNASTAILQMLVDADKLSWLDVMRDLVDAALYPLAQLFLTTKLDSIDKPIPWQPKPMTLLQRASYISSDEDLNWLQELINSGADVKAQKQDSPLQIIVNQYTQPNKSDALLNRALEIITKAGVKPDCTNEKGDSPIQIIVNQLMESKKSRPLLKVAFELLVNTGANVDAQNTATKKTPLHSAVECKDVDVINFLVWQVRWHPCSHC